MRARSFVASSIALALFSCKREGATIGRDPIRERDASELEPKVVVVDAAIDAAIDTADADEADAFVRALPPRDESCKVDADCAVTFYEIAGPQTCCGQCGSIAGNRAWTKAIDALCGKPPWNPRCPAIDCPAGPMHAKCVAGKCVGVF